MRVLDTRSMPAQDRADAFQSAVSSNSTVSLATFENAAQLHALMSVYDLGPAKVFNIESTGTTLRRTARAAREMNDCPIALALPIRTTNRLVRQGEDDSTFGPRDLILVDLSAPYIYNWSGQGASFAFHVEYDELGVPMDLVRRAARSPAASPLYSLVRDHILRVVTDAEAIEESGAARELGMASVELMRALILSIAGSDSDARAAMATTVRTRVHDYIRSHLRDPELTPTRIASANAVSLRTLYKLYEGHDVSLEQSIIELRLDGARADLATPSLSHRTIGAVARSWGFTNPSFFSSRFSQTFGQTPREWRALSAATRRRPTDALN